MPTPIILSNVSVVGLRLFNTCHAHFRLICRESSSGHLLHAEDHMPFATAQREKPPKPKGCIQNPEPKSPFQWQTLVTSDFYMCGDVQRTVASQYNEEKALTCASKPLIC